MWNIYALPKYHKKRLHQTLQVRESHRVISFMTMLETCKQVMDFRWPKFDSFGLFGFNKKSYWTHLCWKAGWLRKSEGAIEFPPIQLWLRVSHRETKRKQNDNGNQDVENLQWKWTRAKKIHAFIRLKVCLPRQSVSFNNRPTTWWHFWLISFS